jgi:SRSO17 transposase
MANCQVAASLHLVTDDACMPLDFAPYLPERWTQDRVCMRKVGVRDRAVSWKKWQIARDLIDEASKWDIPKGGCGVRQCLWGRRLMPLT